MDCLLPTRPRLPNRTTLSRTYVAPAFTLLRTRARSRMARDNVSWDRRSGERDVAVCRLLFAACGALRPVPTSISAARLAGPGWPLQVNPGAVCATCSAVSELRPSAFLGRLSSRIPSTGRTTCFACYLPQPLDRDYTDLVDPDIVRHRDGATTSESTPLAHAARVTLPALYLSARRGLTVTGALGCRICRRTVPSFLPLCVYVWGAASFFLLRTVRRWSEE